MGRNAGKSSWDVQGGQCRGRSTQVHAASRTRLRSGTVKCCICLRSRYGYFFIIQYHEMDNYYTNCTSVALKTKISSTVRGVVMMHERCHVMMTHSLHSQSTCGFTLYKSSFDGHCLNTSVIKYTISLTIYQLLITGESQMFAAQETYQRALLHWSRAASQGRQFSTCAPFVLSHLHFATLFNASPELARLECT